VWARTSEKPEGDRRCKPNELNFNNKE